MLMDNEQCYHSANPPSHSLSCLCPRSGQFTLWDWDTAFITFGGTRISDP
jgi:hypothetical protein